LEKTKKGKERSASKGGDNGEDEKRKSIIESKRKESRQKEITVHYCTTGKKNRRWGKSTTKRGGIKRE